MSKALIMAVAVSCVSGCGGGSGGDSVSGTHTVNIVRTPAQLRWTDADAYCRNTAILGQSGWRLPTLNEITAYAKSGADLNGGAAWSSTQAQPSFHYYVSLNNTNGTALTAEDISYFAVRCAHD